MEQTDHAMKLLQHFPDLLGSVVLDGDSGGKRFPYVGDDENVGIARRLHSCQRLMQLCDHRDVENVQRWPVQRDPGYTVLNLADHAGRLGWHRAVLAMGLHVYHIFTYSTLGNGVRRSALKGRRILRGCPAGDILYSLDRAHTLQFCPGFEAGASSAAR